LPESVFALDVIGESGAQPRAVRRPLPRLLIAALALVLFLCVGGPALAAPAVTVYHGPTDKPRIALTLDDNFRPELAVPAIHVLMQYGAKATMFVTGMYTNGQPAINQAMIQALAQGGFEIGDHSATHPDLTSLSWSGLMYEIGAGTAAFRERTGGRTVPLMRPPYGRSNDVVAEAAGEKGFQYVVQWDVDPSDWQGYSAETITSTVLRNAHNGAIVLLHMSATHTFEALPGIIKGLRDRGYELVTVSELLKGDRRFLDVTQATPGSSSVERLVAGGLMSGYDDSYFGPSDPMTRAQFAKVAVLVAGLHTPGVEAAGRPTFEDVPLVRDASGNPLEYPFDFVEEAVAAGLISGVEGTGGARRFDPYGDITRLQMARMVARMARVLKGYPQVLSAAGAPEFSDVPVDALADVRLVAQLGLMDGYSAGRFAPWEKAQRDHVAVVMARFLDLLAYQGPPPTTTTTTAPTTTTTMSTTTTGPTSTSSPTTTTTTEPHLPPPVTSTGTTGPTPPSTVPPPVR
jgi:peptidoglycan-N-acetylglucosamine deacetylase